MGVAITIFALEEALTKAPIFPINLFRTTVNPVAAVGDAVGAVVDAVAESAPTPALDALVKAYDNGAAGDGMGEALAAPVAAVGAAVDAVSSGVGDAAVLDSISSLP